MAKLLSFLIVGLVIACYYPTLFWMKERFLEPESYYTHGFLLPFICLFLIWQKKEKLKALPVISSKWGLVLFLAGLFIHIFSLFLKINFLSGFSLIAVIFGLVLYFFGGKITRELSFPILFLIFAIPLPSGFTIALAFNMKLWATTLSVMVAKAVAIPAVQVGSDIILPNTSLTVGYACSGLRSLISLTAMATLFAYFLRTSLIKSLILLLLVIPLTIISNLLRLLFLIFIAYIYGSEVAVSEPLHTICGLSVFVVAFWGLLWIGNLLAPKEQT
ncbi:MAG: exosortase [bacterium]